MELSFASFCSPCLNRTFKHPAFAVQSLSKWILQDQNHFRDEHDELPMNRERTKPNTAPICPNPGLQICWVPGVRPCQRSIEKTKDLANASARHHQNTCANKHHDSKNYGCKNHAPDLRGCQGPTAFLPTTRADCEKFQQGH